MAGENKSMKRRKMLRMGFMLTVILIINVVLKFAIIWINNGEYTDGVLQVTQFELLYNRQAGGAIWPPLYSAIVWPFSFIFGQLWAARFVSTVFSIAAVVPLFLLAKRCFGVRPALFTALLYTVAPAALRWSPRMMTEATFTFFFWFAIERLLAVQGSRSE